MRRRPSGSTSEEEQDPSSSDVLSPTATTTEHGDKLFDRLSGVGNIVVKDTGHARDRRKDNAAVQPPSPGKTHPWDPANAAATPQTPQELPPMKRLAKDITPDSMLESSPRRRSRWRNPWACSFLTIATTLLAAGILFVIVQSFNTRQLDPKGCRMSYMRPSFIRFPDFDTEHTRFASKYSLYLYREGGLDEDEKVNENLVETGTALTFPRSKASRFYSSQEMQGATNRFAQSPPRLRIIIITSSNTT